MDDLDVARAAAAAAGRVIAGGDPGGAEFKGAVNPVTEIDRLAEAAATDVILEHRPDDALLAEEGGGSGAGDRRWVIDPLDGTVNFVHGVPHVGVSVALEADGVAVVGVVLDPARGEEFTATRDGGARLNGAPIEVSATTDVGQALLSTGFPYDRRERAADYTRVISAVLGVAQGVRRGGSAALDLAWLACGRFDGHWEFGLQPWDVAAGLLILTEAGGVATASDGGPPSHLDLVATNGHIHESLRSVVRNAWAG